MTFSRPGGEWLLFHKDLLLVKSKTPLSLPSSEDEPLFRDRLTVSGILPPTRGSFPWGEYPGDDAPPPGYEGVGLRELWALGGEPLFHAAGTAFQMMDWKRNSRFCPRCGAPMNLADSDRAYGCPECSYMAYPILSPAVIVAVTRDDRLLLARSPHFPKGRYSVLAGFVEPGESLEETVEREIFEEVGIRIKNIAYFGSQPWPFPHSLMLGFTAEWAGGELTPDGKEIEDAGWFTARTMPEIPPSISISRRLIEHWLAGRNE
ncbi:MAG: NAD(+) diphosphatase [Aminivibrio sp.]|uniref:NAD(+) diphosphatase n=1 Tax=Aminivibrio sp. TaxID=1872489 RepID=UPI002B1EE527|nr:NAD(+) diphosphatase [Aminivibrio sp.]MEA4952359.1 NAD(+) diphosphatase [Aminivibrio sp.]